MHNRVTLLFLVASLAALTGSPAHADKIVDPGTVAPEFRQAAEKRRAEQLKLIECNDAAKTAKIQKRELAQFVSACFDRPTEKTQ